ncbi:MAG TPA: threo-3-hydroxy-L-aspartate ammonia-lyase [Thermoanaerobaculales bacterium]|nr:threo-3-hydroxy-L-aspartate ammonia-lyase [Thermoanaerobaculales bacterium]HPA81535.1 threo-3-hydroxy-L-aspartate ammonia-lyase [Thermoanaerobaculales bacterium]HQL30061.1 threo-3-hydroxy-L-aspartate ammonia-lyase [Thermoanaerobaculales bacterium]HQN96867.1 threo-3-hydroxy-L-aspartate ammonia-lyase [Thermoanaerobaculales bacterium]
MTTPYPAGIDVDLDRLEVEIGDIAAAAARLEGVVHRTPVMGSGSLDRRAGGRVALKCESFQRTGAFKIRGAYNALAQLSYEDRRRGVLTYSSGNHAQAAALAGRLLGIDVQVVMPADAPPVKLAATRAYGATVISYDRGQTTREALAARLAAETGRTVVPPYDHPHVVAGQGTVALELIQDAGPLDLLLVPCGGGGLLSGSAVAAAALAPLCRVVGVEPEAGADATASFRTGVLHRVDDPDTIADGARTPHLGRVTFPLVRRYVHEMVTVPDEALVRAVRFLAERMKLVVEPTGALAVAALLEGVVAAAPRTGVIISGGNVDPAALARCLA